MKPPDFIASTPQTRQRDRISHHKLCCHADRLPFRRSTESKHQGCATGPQVILGWLTEDGSIHERCVTRRVRATLSPSAYLQSVDAPAAALLLAKRIVLEAARTGAARDRAAAAQLRAAIGAVFWSPSDAFGSFLTACA